MKRAILWCIVCNIPFLFTNCNSNYSPLKLSIENTIIYSPAHSPHPTITDLQTISDNYKLFYLQSPARLVRKRESTQLYPAIIKVSSEPIEGNLSSSKKFAE